MENIEESRLFFFNRFISVSGYLENSKYILSICNNGSVIPQQDLSKVFEMGFSTKNNRNKEYGFGLYITKQYIEENNGEISVSSCEDETEFIIMFPVVE
jgi:sensor histidine kinase regulating citrate/malate metabolism